MVNDRIESIRGRLQQARCSDCYGWITPAEQRVPSLSVGNRACSCPVGTHNSLRFDVDDEDVEFLLGEVDRMRAAFDATMARLQSDQRYALEHEANGNITIASVAIGHAITNLRGEFHKDS